MRESSAKVIAVDCGAGSMRFAVATLTNGRISLELIHQQPHEPHEVDGCLRWEFGAILDFCRAAVRYGADIGAASIGFDTWGVDHGFIDAEGTLLQDPVAYRDSSHSQIADRCLSDRDWLYAQTGIQHQPFNTLFQLMARKDSQPHLFDPEVQWLLLPDLIVQQLGGPRGYEWSMASTTQLTGAGGQWNAAVFDRFGLPMPPQPVSDVCRTRAFVNGVELMRVAGHDTACAVAGMGSLQDAAFLNIGTWALIGTIGDFDPTQEAAELNLTHERTVDNQVRRLCNVPGMFIADRIADDLGIADRKAWLSNPTASDLPAIPVLDSALYNPESMVEALRQLTGNIPDNLAQWAGWALESLVEGIVSRIPIHAKRLRVTGGASNNAWLCQRLADRSGLTVYVGPTEATLLGNAAIQFELLGAIESARTTVDASVTLNATPPVNPS